MKKQYGFYFESDRCIKCLSCEIACQQWKGIKAGTIKLRRVLEQTCGKFPEVTRKFISISCNHCEEAPCIVACPTGAIRHRTEDGIVIVDNSLCNGCHQCLEACPFGIPQFAEDGTMQICDMCLDRVDRGQVPICAAACPTRALHWGNVRELSDIAVNKIEKIPFD